MAEHRAWLSIAGSTSRGPIGSILFGEPFGILFFPFNLVAYHPPAHVQEHEHVQRIVFRGKLTKRNLLHLGITFAEDGSRQGKIVANWPLLWTTPIRNTTKL